MSALCYGIKVYADVSVGQLNFLVNEQLYIGRRLSPWCMPVGELASPVLSLEVQDLPRVTSAEWVQAPNNVNPESRERASSREQSQTLLPTPIRTLSSRHNIT
jgi:hypothetical protein